MGVAENLAAAGFALPEPPAPKGAYVPAVRAGGLVFTAGQLPVVAGSLMTSGRLGEEVSAELGRKCAERAALNALAAASTVCDLDEVAAVAKLVGYVASARRFTDQADVMNGASEVMRAAFGDRGAHPREAVGVAELPLGAPVEVSVILAL